ncbi:MAG: CaiB/BaiF CoA transferase family protein [Acidimicrobiales bacterium]
MILPSMPPLHSSCPSAARSAKQARLPEPSSHSTPGLLAGVVVLDLSNVGPASRCSRLLADYGATVVKVGSVPARDDAPVRPRFYAYSGSRGFRRMAVDLKDPDGLEVFASLVATADVVLESFRPGVADRLGIGYGDLAAINPRIILCSTTGYGQSGPRSDWAGHDINYLAVSGYLASSGPRADGGPPIAGATLADGAGGGMQAAMAVMAALFGRDSNGAGCHLDVSIADGVLWLTSLGVDEYLATGAEVGPGHDIISGRYACYDCYQASDGRWLAVGAIEPKFYANLCRRLGCEQWIEQQLDDGAQPKIRADFRAAFATRDQESWVAELAGADTCVSPVQSIAELIGDDQYHARGAIVDVVMESGGAAGVDGGSEGSEGGEHRDGRDGRGPEIPHRFRQVAPLLAGMVRPSSPVILPHPSASDVESLLGAVGIPAERIAELLAKGAVA